MTWRQIISKPQPVEYLQYRILLKKLEHDVLNKAHGGGGGAGIHVSHSQPLLRSWYPYLIFDLQEGCFYGEDHFCDPFPSLENSG